ncbi:MAG TPA: hydrogenase maturation protease [Bryobacteraceae bacterium]|nr:hydrogenase maturation protease [Bryobacteraceae bacterium]
MKGSVLIVGVGNELLGDEGLGVHVARLLRSRKAGLPGSVRVLEAGTALFDLAGEMGRHQHVILVDAIRAGGRPGTIYRLELDEIPEGDSQGSPPLSLHDEGLFQLLARIRLLGLLPSRLTLIGAEPACLTPSLNLSPRLRRAAARIAAILKSEVLRRQQTNTGPRKKGGSPRKSRPPTARCS